MRRKTANEEVKKILKNAVDEIYLELENESKVAQIQMCVAEDELVKTFTKEQLKLYKEFCQKRENFYNKVSALYTRVDKK